MESGVWKYFTKNKDPLILTVTCTVCAKVKSVKSSSPTQNLAKHLKIAHNITITSKGTSVNHVAVPQQPRKRQSTLLQYGCNKISQTEKSRHDRRLTSFICETYSSFDIVGHSSFVNFCQGLKPGYNPPSRHTLSRG